ncbi:MAG TPA: YigZ family protein [Thermoanaerobaculia bacterium]|nr:YigZ family protein [Thermoanaerobaculia bacterium]
MNDHYRTIAASCEHRLKVERSDFLGIAFPATTDEEFFAELARIEKRFFDATHHCWAFRLFASGDVRARSSDAGEPSGTAGKPILGAIESAGLHDLGLVVVRWFGGVKLGTGGLSRAYRSTAIETLKAARTEERFIYDTFRVVVPFAMLGSAYRLADPPAVVLDGEEFGEVNIFTFRVRTSLAEAFRKDLAAKRLEVLEG